MELDDDTLTLEALDEQIDRHAQARRPLPPGSQPTSTTRLIQGLSHLYENEQADVQSVEEVRQRLIESGALPAVLRQRPRPSRVLPGQAGAWQPSPQADHPARRRWSLAQRLTAIAAAVVLLALVGGLTAGLILVRQHPTSVSSQATATPGQTVASTTTQPPASPLEITYIGRDGNIWSMTLPNGTPQQWTNQARNGAIQYSGLAWSPDGSYLAALRTNIAADGTSTYTLLIFSADGTVLHHISLPGPPDNQLFAWSPDGHTIAYREFTGGNNAGSFDKLLLFDATSGNLMKSVAYFVGKGSGCGGGSTWLLGNAISAQHDVGFGIQVDTLAWAPAQSTILVAYGCNSGAAAQIDLQTGKETPGFPEGASYQPGGNLILGQTGPGAIGLVDTTGKKVRTLVVNPDVPAYTSSQHYALLVGRALWSQDGQTIYYEYDDSIWQIKIDGTEAHVVVSGTADDSQMQATVEMLGSFSSNGHQLLYIQLKGSADESSRAPVATRWYVAQADGSNPIPLPQGITEAVWQPGKR